MRRALWALCFVCASGLGACVAPPSQAQRVTESARELNLATRFGRMDMALGRTAKGAQSSFLERRADWGKNVRILDVELSGLAMKDETHAVVQVDVEWVRSDEDTLRTTRLKQTWRDDGGWHLVREQRLAGDLGLFGEHVEMPHAPPRDVQFEAKTIR
jgi:hypothetical protein